MRQAVLAQRHELADLRRSIGQAKPVLEVALVLAELVGELPDAVAMFVDHPVVHRGFIEWRQVLALEVLDDRDLERRVVVDLLDQGGDRLEPGETRCAPAAFARDDLVGIRTERSDEDRLEDAVLANRCGELFERLRFEDHPRLLGIRFDVIDLDDADTDRPGRTVRRQKTDDRRGEFGVLGQPARGCRAEISSGQVRSPPGQGRDKRVPRCCRLRTS